MSMYLEKVKNIVNKFKDKDKDELIEFYVSLYKEYLNTTSDINYAKLEFLKDISFFESEKLEALKEETMNCKILQTRAVILDLIATDYSKNTYFIETPEEWVLVLVRDIYKDFKVKDNFYKELLHTYNAKLIGEFGEIFLSQTAKFGTAGNRLLVDLMFYNMCISKIVDTDMGQLLEGIKLNFKPNCMKSLSEIEECVTKYMATFEF